MKRGVAEALVFIAVAAVALFGLFFVNVPGAGKATMTTYQSCVDNCYNEFSPGDARLDTCLDGCDSLAGFVKQTEPTGKFAVQSPAKYGGAISGVGGEGTRAFPGRAFEIPEQSCFTCGCLDEGITAVDRADAERVCRDNCGGAVTDVIAGACR